MLGTIALAILLAIGAIGIGLLGLRMARQTIDPEITISPGFVVLTAVFCVTSIACWVGAVHLFQQIGG